MFIRYFVGLGAHGIAFPLTKSRVFGLLGAAFMISTKCLWASLLILGACSSAQSQTPTVETSPAKSSPNQPQSAAPPSPPAPLPDGLVLKSVGAPALYPLGDALLISTFDVDEDKPRERHFYLVQQGRLQHQKGLRLAPDMASSHFEAVGLFPNRVFAIAHGSDENNSYERLLQYKHDAPEGWVDLKAAVVPFWLAAWKQQIWGFVKDPAQPLNLRLTRLDGSAPDIPLPKGNSQACQAFYSKAGTGSFPKLEVQPRGLVSAGGRLFVMGMGCESRLTMAIWSSPEAAPELVTLDEPMFFDGRGGTVLSAETTNAQEFWYFRQAMRPMALAALWHGERGHWSKIAWPEEDPEVERLSVDESGRLWGIINAKLYVYEAGTQKSWKEHPLPSGCEARSVVAMGKVLWIACGNAVARQSISIQKP